MTWYRYSTLPALVQFIAVIILAHQRRKPLVIPTRHTYVDSITISNHSLSSLVARSIGSTAGYEPVIKMQSDIQRITT
jgi:hypothetical protein